MPNRPTSELVLLTGYDPVIRVPQTRVLPLHQSSVKWCPWRDSNSQHLDSKSSASTNWTTGAIMERSRGIKPLASAWKAEVLSLYELREMAVSERVERPTF